MGWIKYLIILRILIQISLWEFIFIVDRFDYLLDCIFVILFQILLKFMLKCVTELSLKKGKLLELVWQQEPQSPKQLNCLFFREVPYQIP